jgi:tricorn protease
LDFVMDVKRVLAALIFPVVMLATAPGNETPGSGSTAAGPPVRLASSPALSPDGGTVVFVWRGDLWSVASRGGRAVRLTSHPAEEGDPVFSPDGRSLYFSSFRDGPRHLFSMPAQGGPVTRHSHHSEGLRLQAIHPDGRSALVRALRDHPGYEGRRLFRLPLQDDTRRGESWVTGIDLNSPAIHPDGRRMLACRWGESVYRKGYRGSRSSSIWLVDPVGQVFDPLVREPAGARSPLWHPSGDAFYYVSERDGCWNLWLRDLKSGKDRQCTRFTDDGVESPALSADGSLMVFSRGSGLWSWRPEEGDAPREIPVTHHRDDVIPAAELLRIQSTSEADVSASGLEIVFAAEGRLFAMDTVLRQPNPVTTGPSRHMSPRFSRDGGSILAVDDSGTHRRLVRIQRADKGSFWWQAKHFDQQVLAGDEHPVHSFKVCPKGREIAIVDVHGTLSVLSADGAQPPRVVHRSWEPFDFDWSPDGRWMAVATRNADYNRDVWLVRLDGSQPPFNLSRHPGREGTPKWSPDGRMIAFLGERKPGETRIHLVHLTLEDHLRTQRERQRAEAEERMSKDPWYRDQSEAGGNGNEEAGAGDPAASEPGEKREGVNPTAEPGKADREQADPAAKTPESQIDFEDLHERVVTLDSEKQIPSQLIWSADSKALLFQSTDSDDKAVYRIEPRADAKPTKFSSFRGTPLRIEDESTSYWIIDGAPAVLKKTVVTHHTFSSEILRQRRDHLIHGFHLAWRTIRDRFYDPALNHLDWDAVRLKYLPLAADAATSTEFSLVINRMFGELNASHVGFSPNTWPAADTDPSWRFQRTRHTGIRFAADGDGWLRVAAVIPGTPADAARPAIPVGARLVEVDGREVAAHDCLARLFNGLATDDLRLTLETGEGGELLRHTLRPITFEQARELGRIAEIRASRSHVDERSGGSLGYIHIARMYQQDFDAFQREVFAAGYGKDGLVIDIRDNRGGFIADHLLTILSQPVHAFTVARGGEVGRAGERTIYTVWDKPVVVITNQNSYSNAEVFAHAIQSTGRGKVVGTPGHGAVISTIRVPLLDLGMLNIPFRGWFHPETGRDLEMGPAIPDHPVENTPGEILSGIDRELDVAVDVLLKETRDPQRRGAVKPVYRSAVDPR